MTEAQGVDQIGGVDVDAFTGGRILLGLQGALRPALRFDQP